MGVRSGRSAFPKVQFHVPEPHCGPNVNWTDGLLLSKMREELTPKTAPYQEY